MQITLTSKEFDEAVSLWLKEQGFTTDRYDISTRVIAGRSDGPLGTRVEVTLEPTTTPYLCTAMRLGDTPTPPNLVRDGEVGPIPMPSGIGFPPKRFGQGHSDE